MVSKKMYFLVSVLLCAGLIAASAFAVLPPKYYAKAAEESNIKATAVVKSVKVLEHHKAVDYKRVTFELIKSYGPEKPPKEFTGRCESVNKRWWEKSPGVGGTIYYYPKKKEKAYVTINHNDGSITSYTRLTPKLEKALDTDFKSVKTKMGTAYAGK
ncbi:hypothetical protein ACFL4E_03595 [Candidatus Omnitrophota bacterium]